MCGPLWDISENSGSPNHRVPPASLRNWWMSAGIERHNGIDAHPLMPLLIRILPLSCRRCSALTGGGTQIRANTGRDGRDQKHSRCSSQVQCRQPQYRGSRFPVLREALDLHSCREIRSLKSWGSPRLASQSDQVGLLLNGDILTLGAHVQLCSEAKWPGGDVGGDSQSEVALGRFG